jgi:hypothetical protein
MGTCNSFEALRAAFAYGVFCYEIFSLVNNRGLLVFEQALRRRTRTHTHGKSPRTSPCCLSAPRPARGPGCAPDLVALRW